MSAELVWCESCKMDGRKVEAKRTLKRRKAGSFPPEPPEYEFIDLCDRHFVIWKGQFAGDTEADV